MPISYQKVFPKSCRINTPFPSPAPGWTFAPHFCILSLIKDAYWHARQPPPQTHYLRRVLAITMQNGIVSAHLTIPFKYFILSRASEQLCWVSPERFTSPGGQADASGKTSTPQCDPLATGSQSVVCRPQVAHLCRAATKVNVMRWKRQERVLPRLLPLDPVNQRGFWEHFYRIVGLKICFHIIG